MQSSLASTDTTRLVDPNNEQEYPTLYLGTALPITSTAAPLTGKTDLINLYLIGLGVLETDIYGRIQRRCLVALSFLSPSNSDVSASWARNYHHSFHALETVTAFRIGLCIKFRISHANAAVAYHYDTCLDADPL